MHHTLEVLDGHAALSLAAAEYVADHARAAVDARGTFSFAVSGGTSPWEMFAVLTTLDMPWDATVIWQVDERVAPAADPDRNLAHLRAALGDKTARVMPMPVEDHDLEVAADRYADGLPGLFDLVHLGIGPDGHTASLVPQDPVLDVTDRLVAVTAGLYEGRRRMTLTYPGLSRTRQLMWLVSGEDKQEPLSKLIAGDPSIPAGRVTAPASLVLADRAAAGSRLGG
jgi:6-phosphogluconolactonase